MSKFERPANTIEDAADLKVGDRVWHVYGIWPPQMGGEFVITRSAQKFRLHPEYNKIHSSSGDLIVFDERWANSNIRHMCFASDCNMQPDHSHNDNYCFRSEDEALAAVEFLTGCWKEKPGLIEEELARREEDRWEWAAE